MGAPVRATTCRQTRQEAPRDDLLSGVHALLHAEPEGQFQDWNAHREISLAAQSHVVAGPAATNPALVGPGTGQHSQRRAEGPLRLLRHCRKLSFPAKGPSGGRTLLAQNAVQPELGRAHHVGHVPPDQTAAADLATKAVPSLSGVTSSRSAVNHLLKSVVREICTLRSVGTGGGLPPPVTRCRRGPRLPALPGLRAGSRPPSPAVAGSSRHDRGPGSATRPTPGAGAGALPPPSARRRSGSPARSASCSRPRCESGC